MTSKDVKNMTETELKEQLKQIKHHIKHFSCGRTEFMYQSELLSELARRKNK
jgi:hypothetical protein